MISKLLWLSFGMSIAFGIVAFTLMILIVRNKNTPKNIGIFMQICWLLWAVLGTFVSIQWCF